VTVPVYGEGVVTAVQPGPVAGQAPGWVPGWVEVELRDGDVRRFRAPEPEGGRAGAAEPPPPARESPFDAGLAEAAAAERRIVAALPEMGEAARDPELRKSLRQALGQARDRLERLAELRGARAEPEPDDEPADEVLRKLLDDGRSLSETVRDDGSGADDALLAVARRIVEHRAAAYGRLALRARMDGHEARADELDEIVVHLAGSGERLAGLVTVRIHPAASRDLDDLTREQLYERARELDVSGRSRMSKAELKQAVAERSGSAAM
jgi:ferritin-like metal-binding protein YciE